MRCSRSWSATGEPERDKTGAACENDTTTLALDPDRFFDPDPAQRRVARELYAACAGSADRQPARPRATRGCWPTRTRAFGTPADLFIIPDHYVFRMLYSQGIPLEELGVPRRDGEPGRRPITARSGRCFAENFHLFRGTPTGALAGRRAGRRVRRPARS